jgi:hypothetical protein
MHLRTIRGLEQSTIVFIPESNYAFSGQYAAQALYKLGLRVVTMNEDHNRAGIRTNNLLKKMMARIYAEQLKRGRIMYHRDFFTLDENCHIDDLKKEMIRQFGDYTCIKKESSRDPYGENIKEIYTGKINNKPDDIIISLQLNELMKRQFYSNPEKYSMYYGR